jgi:hypothetical protein
MPPDAILKFPTQADTPESALESASRVWNFDAATLARMAETGDIVSACLMPDDRLVLVPRPRLEAHAARPSS